MTFFSFFSFSDRLHCRVPSRDDVEGSILVNQCKMLIWMVYGLKLGDGWHSALICNFWFQSALKGS
jgi:hypothetical protein